jgi:hypothetical protein
VHRVYPQKFDYCCIRFGAKLNFPLNCNQFFVQSWTRFVKYICPERHLSGVTFTRATFARKTFSRILEISVWANVTPVKCHSGQMSFRQMSSWHTSLRANVFWVNVVRVNVTPDKFLQANVLQMS